MNNQPYTPNSGNGQPSYTPYLQPVPGSATPPPTAPQPATTTNPIPTAPLPKPPKQKNSFPLTIITIVASLVAVTFIGLFLWMWAQWDDARTNLQGQIDAATAIAVSENTTDLESQFTEREKYPYVRFSTPEDYGALEFEYPKTWSVYVSSDASRGGNFSAILNPDRIVAGEQIYALRVDISTASYEDALSRYNSLVESGNLSHSTQVINNATANIYRGSLNGSSDGSYGAILLIKIRDKVATLQTDAQAYEADFNQIISSIKYNE